MIEIWISNQEVWWNRGVEVKPSREAFARFTFERVNNFNISWVDETHINVIVPNNKKATLIKIIDPNDDDGVTVKYYYLLEVLNKTSKNKECIYQLDIWLTYILNSDILGTSGLRTINSIKTLDINSVNDNVEIESFGIPTGRIENKIIEFPWQQPILNDYQKKLVGNENYRTYKLLARSKRGVAIEKEKIVGSVDNIYFVFTSQDNKFSNVEKNKMINYVLIPILDIDTEGCYLYSLIHRENYTRQEPGGNIGGVPRFEDYVVINYVNSFKNIINFINSGWKTKFQCAGLGEFLGVWVGPSFWRVKENQLSTTSRLDYPGVIPITDLFYGLNNVFLDSPSYWGKIGIGLVGLFPEEIINFEKEQQRLGKYRSDWNISSQTFVGFLSLKISNDEIKMFDLLYDKTDFLKNYRYLNTSSLTRKMNSFYFNKKFSFTNGKDVIESNIITPIAFDNYQNLLSQQEASMNTSLKISGVNAILSTIGGAIGIFPPPPTESITTTSFTNTRDVDTVTTTGPQSWTKYNERQQAGAIRDKTTNRIWGPDSFGKRDILLKSISTYNRDPNRILNLKSSNEKAAFDRVNRGSITNSGTRSVTRTGNRSIGVGGLLGAGLGAVKGGLQFASTLWAQEAYKANLRVSTSNTVTNYTDEYILHFSNLKKSTKLPTVVDSIEDIRNYLNKEIIYGATTIPGKLANFYGYDTIPTPIGGDVSGITNEAYILIDELTKLNLEVRLSNRYTPTIKSAIITLLTNGVRMTNSPSIFEYFEDVNENEKAS